MLVLFVILCGLFLTYFITQKNKKVKLTKSEVSAPKIDPIGDAFKWNEHEPLNFRPFAGKKNFRPSLGIKNIADKREDLFLIENTYLDSTNLRRKYVETYPDKVMHCHPNWRTTEAVREFYELTIHFLCDRYPQYFKVEHEKNTVLNLINNDSFPYDGSKEDPKVLLRVLASNIEEDFLIMLKDNPEEEDEEYILRSSLTGSPAGFDPSQNFDQPISAIHGPVPQYKGRLASPMSRFFNKLEPKDLWQRGNWSIQTNNVLFKLEDHHGRDGEEIHQLKVADIDFDNACYMRCERQILTRMPKSRANIMLVRTYLTPVKQLKAEGWGTELANAIEALPEDLAFYKRRHAWGAAVTEYLRSK